MWTGRGEKEGSEGSARELKMGQLALRMGPARVEVPFFGQRSTIPSKRVFFFTFIYTKHAINIVYEIAMFIAGHKIIKASER